MDWARSLTSAKRTPTCRFVLLQLTEYPSRLSLGRTSRHWGDTCVESGHKNLDRLGKGGLLTRPMGDRSLEVADEVEVWRKCRSYVARDLFGPGPHFLVDGNEGLIWETYLAVVFQGCFFRVVSFVGRDLCGIGLREIKSTMSFKKKLVQEPLSPL